MLKFSNVCLSILFALLITNAAIAKGFDENIHFTRIQPEPTVGEAGSKIEVIEFFMHACPHCYHFEPEIQSWLKNKANDIQFTRIPALFGRHFDMHARTYYALEAIGEIDRLHEALFHEIHENKNRLTTREEMESFLASKQVDLGKFRGAIKSFAVNTKINRAKTLLKRYEIRGVPALVIDGRYKNASGLKHQEMTQLIDFLAEKIRQERKEQ